MGYTTRPQSWREAAMRAFDYNRELHDEVERLRNRVSELTRQTIELQVKVGRDKNQLERLERLESLEKLAAWLDLLPEQ